MRVLFYLPVVTDWWFNDFVKPLIRLAAAEAEVHIVVPVAWRMTGVSPAQLQACSDLPDIRWHILDGEDHRSYRTSPAAADDLVAFVRQIDPDYVFCRSVDNVTPEQFPGKVRYLMEADYPPLFPERARHSERIQLQGPGLMDHGVMPPLEAKQRAWLHDYAAPLWTEFLARQDSYAGDRESYLAQAGLPLDRKIIALPFDYESPENFFGIVHSLHNRNDLFLDTLLEQLGENSVLAVTTHPTQPQTYTDAARGLLARYPGKVFHVAAPGRGPQPTRWLTQYCDAMIVRDSKSVINCGFFGKSFLRLSRFRTGEWMNAYSDAAEFFRDVEAGVARAPSLADALTWFAFHHANNAFAPGGASFTLADLLDRADRPVDPGRWQANLERHRAEFRNWSLPPMPVAA